MLKYGWIFGVLISLTSFGGDQLIAQGKKSKARLSYRVMTNAKAYDRVNRFTGVTILVTPPTTKSVDKTINVEIYNNTRFDLAQVDFNIFFQNTSSHDFDAHLTVDRTILKKRSAIKRIATPGNKAFPMINKVIIQQLRIYNTDAAPVLTNVEVILVRS